MVASGSRIRLREEGEVLRGYVELVGLDFEKQAIPLGYRTIGRGFKSLRAHIENAPSFGGAFRCPAGVAFHLLGPR